MNETKLNIDKIEELIQSGLIYKNKHPEKELYVLNYTPKVQYERLWNEYTIMCRGLIVDENYNIVARSFSKFFNLEEHSPEEIPTDKDFEVFEKMDGSLGILFNYDDEWIIATRGSFISDQALMAKKILADKYDNVFVALNKETTYLLEIIYPENRIVVNYGDESKLVLLAIKYKDGGELSYDEMKTKYHQFLDIVPRYDGINDFFKIKKLNHENKEGFVIKYSNGFRLKIKFDEYVRLHRIITGVSNVAIWEYLKEGKSFDELLDRVPDEFYDWVKDTVSDLNEKFKKIQLESMIDYIYFLSKTKYIKNSVERRKQFALMASKTKYSGLLFDYYVGRNNNENIWNMIKPNYSKPFF